MTTLIQRLGWRSVAALTADGEEYTDYMASLQVCSILNINEERINLINYSYFRTSYKNT